MNENKTGTDYFNESAGKWDEKPQRVALARAVTEKIAGQVRLCNTMDAMEFGCGTGLISMALAPMLKTVLAVDMSENMLAVLDEKIRLNHVDNLFTRKQDVFKEGLPDERFDLIFSSMALHHVNDVNALLKIFKQALRPDGMVALADLDAEDGGFHGDIPDVFHLGFDRWMLIDMFQKIGFSDVNITTAHVMEKENAVTGKVGAFPVFLLTAVKA